VGSDTLVQQTVPAGMLGRAFGAVGAAAQLASGIAYVAAGPLVAAVGPRAALLTAGLGMLSGALILIPALPARHARRSQEVQSGHRPQRRAVRPARLPERR